MSRRTIWKYDVPIEDEFELEMPRGARLLTVQVQHRLELSNEGDVVALAQGVWDTRPVVRSEKDVASLWAIVDPEAPKEGRKFRLVGTGHPFPDADSVLYVGTFQLSDGRLCFHLFAVPASV